MAPDVPVIGAWPPGCGLFLLTQRGIWLLLASHTSPYLRVQAAGWQVLISFAVGLLLSDAWGQVTATQVNVAEANERSAWLMDRRQPRVTPASGSNGFRCSDDTVRTLSHSVPSSASLCWLQSYAGPALWRPRWPSGSWPITQHPQPGGGILDSVVRAPRLIPIGPAWVTGSAPGPATAWVGQAFATLPHPRSPTPRVPT